MKKIAIKHENGTVTILTCLVDDIEGEIKKIRPTFESDVVSWREIDESKLPKDRSKRNNWTDDYDTDTIDEAK